MAKKKKPAAPAPAPAPPEPDRKPQVITWAQVFNANGRTLEDVSSIAARADACAYAFFAHLCRLWAVTHTIVDGKPVVAWRDLGASTDDLGRGIEVSYAGDQPAAAAPAQHVQYVVMERLYDYDDERYHRRDGGFPKLVYDNLPEAERVARELSVQEAVEHDGHLWEFLDAYGDESYDSIVTMPWEMWRDWLMDHGCSEENLPKTSDGGVPSTEDLDTWWQHSDWVINNPKVALEHFDLPFYSVHDITS